MSDINRPDDPGEYNLSESAETAAAEAFRFTQASGATPLDESRGDHGPVPASPLHLCPSCEYELRGILSRRCPECGAAFTLTEARKKGTQKTPEARQDRRAVLTDRLQFATGLVLLPTGFIGAFAYGTTGALMRWVMIVFLISLVGVLLLYKVLCSWSWSYTLFLAGVLTAVLSATLLLIQV